MNLRNFICLAQLIILPSLMAKEPTAAIPITPNYKIEENIVSYRGTGTMDYLGFPAIVPSGENEIMLS